MCIRQHWFYQIFIDDFRTIDLDCHEQSLHLNCIIGHVQPDYFSLVWHRLASETFVYLKSDRHFHYIIVHLGVWRGWGSYNFRARGDLHCIAHQSLREF